MYHQVRSANGGMLIWSPGAVPASCGEKVITGTERTQALLAVRRQKSALRRDAAAL